MHMIKKALKLLYLKLDQITRNFCAPVIKSTKGFKEDYIFFFFVADIHCLVDD